MKFRIAGALLLALGAALAAQPKGESSKFTVRWYGQAFVTVTTPAGRVIAFEPQVMDEFPRADKVKADVVCVCHPFAAKGRAEGAVEGAAAGAKVRVLRGYKEERPGRPWDWNLIDEQVKLGEAKYRFRTVGNYRDTEKGKTWGKNAAFVVEAEGLAVCHLGYLGHALTEAEVKAIGPVDVLFVPVGGVYVMNGATAREVVSALEPKQYVFPIVYAFDGQPDTLLPADEFLDGLRAVKKATGSNVFEFDAAEKVQEPITVVLGWKANTAKDKK